MAFDRGKLQQLDFNIIQLQLLVQKVQAYFNDHMAEIAEQHIVPEIRGISLAMNIPSQFAEGVRVTKGMKNSVKIINVWGTPKKPLAKWFNFGTRDHGPVTADALHWKDKKGNDVFAKWVHGVPRTNAMEIGMYLGKKRFIDSLVTQARHDVGKDLYLNG